ncbi:TonB-dependent receptor plug domain-containing protein [Altererythrobacter sp. MF3-039]|uniref:TonB-dependent receptor plug domain-containing protein n=1 Tax=Altererythrobacter sp. MF3-039 TaxID=3252901 RepID=UPI00390C6278
MQTWVRGPEAAHPVMDGISFMMEMHMRKHLLLLSSAAVLWAHPALAQEELTEDEQFPDGWGGGCCSIAGTRIGTITVTATGDETFVSDTGQPVTVISRKEIEDLQGADLTRVLERAPGVTFSRNGGVGGFTGLRIRGAEAEQLLAMIDGVPVNDQAAPGGGFDFGNLLTGIIEKIDLLRGANSTVWGADALGGVMNVTTRREDGASASVEYGSDDTLFATASGGIGDADAFLGVSGGYFRTDGFSAAARGTEPDGFEQWSVSARGNIRLTPTLEAFASGRYAEGDLEIDGFPFPTFTLSDTDEFQDTDQYSGAAGLSYGGDGLDLIASYSFSDTERANFNPLFGADPGFVSDGHLDRVDLRGNLQASEVISLAFGGEYEWHAFETNFDARHTTRIAGAYGQVGISSGGFNAHIGVRQDDHQRFGGATSLGADISYAFGDGWRIRASSGEGFKVPTLFQLFSDFGNELLQPERSRSYDIAIEHGTRGGPLHAAVTLFRRDSNDLIEFVSCFGSSNPICTDRPFGTYNNVAKARAQGFEVELGAKVSERFSAMAVYSHVDAENRTAGAFNEGNDLARRPRHALTASVDWQGPAGIGLGADLRMVGDSFDDAGNFTRLDGYQVVTLRASKAIGEKFEIFGRAENLFDTDYQTAAGYNSRDRAVFVGVRVKV